MKIEYTSFLCGIQHYMIFRYELQDKSKLVKMNLRNIQMSGHCNIFVSPAPLKRTEGELFSFRVALRTTY